MEFIVDVGVRYGYGRGWLLFEPEARCRMPEAGTDGVWVCRGCKALEHERGTSIIGMGLGSGTTRFHIHASARTLAKMGTSEKEPKNKRTKRV